MSGAHSGKVLRWEPGERESRASSLLGTEAHIISAHDEQAWLFLSVFQIPAGDSYKQIPPGSLLARPSYIEFQEHKGNTEDL
jgi:hypothetical protein